MITPLTFQPKQDEQDCGIRRSNLSKSTTWVPHLATTSYTASTQPVDGLIAPFPLDRVFRAKILARPKTSCRISDIFSARGPNKSGGRSLCPTIYVAADNTLYDRIDRCVGIS